MRKAGLFLIAMVVMNACSPISSKLFGITEISDITETYLNNHAKKIGVDSPYYSLDTSWIQKISILSNHSLQNDLLQPLQFIYFKNDSSSCHLINCYVGGFPILKWNRSGTFNSFPPANNFIRYPDTILLLSSLLPFINNMTVTEDYYTSELIVVFYNFYLKRQSKILIKKTTDYCKRFNARCIFVNNDDVLYKLFCAPPKILND